MVRDSRSTSFGESSSSSIPLKPYPFTTATPAPMPKNVSGPKVVSDLRNLLSASSSPDDHKRTQVFGREDVGFVFKKYECMLEPYLCHRFKRSAVIFNGTVKTSAFVLVKPKNAADVSRYVMSWKTRQLGSCPCRVVKYCRRHNLELSVKAGGNGVHGWSVSASAGFCLPV